jgi:membrane-associated phospholipid phosphatase
VRQETDRPATDTRPPSQAAGPASTAGRASAAGGAVSPLASAALALLAAASVWLLYRTLVGTSLGQHVDEAALRLASSTSATATAQLIDALGLVSLVSLAVAVAAVTAIAAVRRRADLAVGALVVVAGANLTTQALKVGLDRPDLGWGTLNSFPSGHVTVVASVAVAALLVSPLWLGSALAVPAVAVVGLTSVATVVAGWHRPSDVVGAVLVCLAWLGLVWSCLPRRAPLRGAAARRR